MLGRAAGGSPSELGHDCWYPLGELQVQAVHAVEKNSFLGPFERYLYPLVEEER